MTEQEIIHLALDNLQQQAGIKGLWKPVTGNGLDGQLSLRIENKTLKYHAAVKKEWRNHHIVHLETLGTKYNPLIVVAGRLFPKIKEALRRQNIAYLEANGNLFLKNNGILLWIDAHKPLPPEVSATGRAFTKTGLKVVFLFLTDETWLNRTYRQIAAYTGTTIGNITHIMTGLKQDGFLLPVTKNKYKITDKKKLLDKWITAYDLRLKPALKIGTFRFLKEQDFLSWKDLAIDTTKTKWGGEPAGDLLTGYLHPAALTLYTTEARNELIRNYRLVPDENGNVTAYKKFWRHDELNERAPLPDDTVVPPLLAYADLMTTGDRRCMETAQKIYNEYLNNL